MATKIAVTGAEGLLGKALVDRCAGEGFSLEPAYSGPCEVFALSERALDVSRRNDVARVFDDIEPDVVFNAAGVEDPDACEFQKWKAYLVNRDGAEHQARAAEKHGALIVYFGSDFIFDGMVKQPYAEEDPPNPLSVYGDVKLAGELVTMSHSKKFLILRSGLVYGAEGRHFVSQFLEMARKEKSVRVHEREHRGPTWAEDLVGAAVFLAAHGHTGTFHAANGGSATEMDVAKELADLLGMDDVSIQSALSAGDRAAMRPSYSVLNCGKLANAGHAMRGWRKAIKDFAESLDRSMVR